MTEEKVLANSTKICYTYDALGRVTARTIKKLSDNSVVSTENYTYDAAGNIKTAADSSFQYDTNNRLTVFQGNAVTYDLDGNMTNNGSGGLFSYDSANRLTSAYGYSYRYNAEDVRIRNLRVGEDSKYTYNTNSRLSQLLMKTTGSTITKYVYGRGLIGEETGGTFKTYHFDLRGSTVAITDASGNITDTFVYDTYGKLLSRTGSSNVIFGYNGRDGVVTDQNGLIYMRARYYAPDMKRFVNADVIAGELSNAVTLNRYAYANGNPVSYVDPFGLSAERGSESEQLFFYPDFQGFLDDFDVEGTLAEEIYNEKVYNAFGEYLKDAVSKSPRPNNIGKGTWEKMIKAKQSDINKFFGPGTKLGVFLSLIEFGFMAEDLYQKADQVVSKAKINGKPVDLRRFRTDTYVDFVFGYIGGELAVMASTALATSKFGAYLGSVVPGLGTLVGAGVGAAVGVGFYFVSEHIKCYGKSWVDWTKDSADRISDSIYWIIDETVDGVKQCLKEN